MMTFEYNGRRAGYIIWAAVTGKEIVGIRKMSELIMIKQ